MTSACSLAHLVAVAVLLAGCKVSGQSGIDDGGVGATGGAGEGGSGGGGAGPSGCVELCIAAHPKGSKDYGDLVGCLYCQECFADCSGVDYGCKAPPTPGACDDQGACSDGDMVATNDCTACALASTCKDVLEACQANNECVKYGQCIQPCP